MHLFIICTNHRKCLTAPILTYIHQEYNRQITVWTVYIRWLLQTNGLISTSVLVLYHILHNYGIMDMDLPFLWSYGFVPYHMFSIMDLYVPLEKWNFIVASSRSCMCEHYQNPYMRRSVQAR